MSLRSAMLQTARRSVPLLDEAVELVRNFILSRANPDGGFQGRTSRSDLYYTVFALDALAALDAPVAWKEIGRWLQSFQDGEGLDLVHLACLARAWAIVSSQAPESLAPSPELARGILNHIELYRCGDGGYAQLKNAPAGTVYGIFLAFGAWQDLNGEVPRPKELIRCLQQLETARGAWATNHESPASSTPATAAAIAVLLELGQSVNPKSIAWLLKRAHAKGGFFANEGAPLPDLLSTATALHALNLAGYDLSPWREPALNFLDSLWTNQGSFHAHWGEETLDCEYTYYGLLALGAIANS